jgi:anti-anti-sigma factor
MYDTVLSSQQPIVIELDRDIGLANAEPWGECLCQAIDWARGDIVVDLSAVPVIHSRGLAMMARVHHHAIAKDCSVTWRGMQPWLLRVLEITGLDPSAPKCGPEITVTGVQVSEWAMRCADRRSHASAGE